MITFEKLSKRPRIFLHLTGVSVSLFLQMVMQIEPLWDNRRDNFDKGGCSYKIKGLENHLLALLIYYRCYITYEFLGYLFNVHETTVLRSVARLERIAVKVIHIEKDRQLSPEGVEYLIVDTTERPIQRPKKRQKRYYSGKKKRHTQKVAFTIDEKGKIRCVSGSHPGKKHDFKIHKESKKSDQFLSIPKKMDKGYTGIDKIDKTAKTPHKKSKRKPLTHQQKKDNRIFSKDRVKVEHTIREVKIFKIMSDVYRNRHKGHNIKVNIIAGIVNLKLDQRENKKPT